MAVLGRNQCQRLPHRISAALRDFAPNVSAYAFDIGNQLVGLFKNVGIDFLQNILRAFLSQNIDRICVIDMSCRDRLKARGTVSGFKYRKNI